MTSDDLLQTVIRGVDACIFSYGQPRHGKYNTLFGSSTNADDSFNSIGLIPLSIYWLYKLINDTKIRYGTRFNVHLSAMEIVGKEEKCRDLLLNADGDQTQPDEDSANIFKSLVKLNADCVEKAEHYFEFALNSRTSCKFINSN